MPDEEVINNGKTRKGEKRVRKSPCPWRSCSFANPTPLAHADASRDVLPRGGTSHNEWIKLFKSPTTIVTSRKDLDKEKSENHGKGYQDTVLKSKVKLLNLNLFNGNDWRSQWDSPAHKGTSDGHYGGGSVSLDR
ncbi:hypothetical protein TNCV_1122071 [Trichonephila clavipes]|nr:hypothetical protein TNCV_1122071 [Trichonephila clavipes]